MNMTYHNHMTGISPDCNGKAGITTTTSAANNNTVPLTCRSFNCHGFMQSSEYVCDNLLSSDIMCLTETWLRPHELLVVNSSIKTNPRCKFECDVFAKSGMQDAEAYRGRPYGGLAVIAKKNCAFNVREIQVPSDRILVVGLYDRSGSLLQVIVCVYMPFFDGSADQTREYIDCIDMLQTIIDKYSPNSKMLLVGDFNTQLPRCRILSRNWYKSPGYNVFSNILYDFICGNNLCALDLHFKQEVNYTYFNHKNGHYTWIDHAFCLQHDIEDITLCKIIPEEPINVSDHLPVQIDFKLALSCQPLPPRVTTHADLSAKIPPNWSNHERNSRYCALVSEKLRNLSINPLKNSNERECLQHWVDERLSCINDAIHSSAVEAGCVPKRPHSPKPYWCPELSKLRDKKRMWWSIWVSGGRPRHGTVYDIFKSVKKQFRKLCRRNGKSVISKDLSAVNRHFSSKNMKAFWNKLNRLQRTKPSSFLTANELANYYKSVMSDDGTLTSEQQKISEYVKKCASENSVSGSDIMIDPERMMKLLKTLKLGTAPGIDGTTADHLTQALSPVLCSVLANFYSIILSSATVPSVFTSGIIVPILKKPSCDPNITSNFRPITLSSVFSKLAELMILPTHEVCDTQFGFREGRGTTFVTSLIHDCATFYNEKNTPLFLCSLDAERCFDSIWHDGLLFKLWPILPYHHWLFLLRWYKSLNATIRWNGESSRAFCITKGMRQGSVLSPALFNIFLDDLLKELKQVPQGLRVHDVHLNSCAYADDVTLMCSTVPGLQELIDKCVAYAKKFRFKFGNSKSQCMIFGKSNFRSPPTWHLDGHLLDIKNDVDILGVNMSYNLSSSKHVTNRISKSRQRLYGLSSIGMSYPGLATDVKTYLWKTVGAPIMTYGLETVSLSKQDMKDLSTAQGSLIKRVMGIPKRSHHTRLLKALKIQQISDVISWNTKKLFYRIFASQTPARDVQMQLLAHYIISGECPKNSLISKLVAMGSSPTQCAFNRPCKYDEPEQDGLVESIRYLVYNDNYIKIDSNEHSLVMLLCKAF